MRKEITGLHKELKKSNDTNIRKSNKIYKLEREILRLEKKYQQLEKDYEKLEKELGCKYEEAHYSI